MINRGKIKGDLQTRGSMENLLQSLFICLNIWEEALMNTKFDQDSLLIQDMVMEMVALETVVGCAGMAFPKLLKRMEFDLPPGVVAATVDNPLYNPKAKDDQSEDKSSDAAFGDYLNDTPEKMD